MPNGGCALARLVGRSIGVLISAFRFPDVFPRLTLGQNLALFSPCLRKSSSCFLTRKIFSEEGKAASTRGEVCLVLFGTDDTENPLADDDPQYYQ